MSFLFYLILVTFIFSKTRVVGYYTGLPQYWLISILRNSPNFYLKLYTVVDNKKQKMNFYALCTDFGPAKSGYFFSARFTDKANVKELLNIVILWFFHCFKYFTFVISFLITFDSNQIQKNLLHMNVILSFLRNTISFRDSVLFNCYLFLLFDIEIYIFFHLRCLFFLCLCLFQYLIIFFFLLFLGLLYEISRGILNFRENLEAN